MNEKTKVLDDYIKYRRLKNHTKKVEDIRFYTKKFLLSTRKKLSEFDDEVLLNHLDKITPKYSINTINNIKVDIKNFIKWYFQDYSSKFRTLDLLCRTEKPEPTYNANDMITEKEFNDLIKKEESRFWKAYFLTLFYGCCRPTEICHLKKDMIEFEEDGAFITIKSKKNKTEFVKFVPSDVAFYLKEMISDDCDYVFHNKRTKNPISVKAAYWRIRKLSDKKLDLYTLRHSIATINYGKDIKDDWVARQMGHSKSQKKNYEHNDLEKLKERARSIYISPEELPPEKKHKLEQEIEKLQTKNTGTKKELNLLKNRVEEIMKNLLPTIKEAKIMIKKQK